MSKIKMFALGGLNELGKNMYVIEVNKDIFIANDNIWFSKAMKKLCGMEFMWEPQESPVGEIVMLKNFFITQGMVEPVCSIIEDECLTKLILPTPQRG